MCEMQARLNRLMDSSGIVPPFLRRQPALFLKSEAHTRNSVYSSLLTVQWYLVYHDNIALTNLLKRFRRSECVWNVALDDPLEDFELADISVPPPTHTQRLYFNLLICITCPVKQPRLWCNVQYFSQWVRLLPQQVFTCMEVAEQRVTLLRNQPLYLSV